MFTKIIPDMYFLDMKVPIKFVEVIRMRIRTPAPDLIRLVGRLVPRVLIARYIH